MTTSMGPPPPRSPASTTAGAIDPQAKISDEPSPSFSADPKRTSMGPSPSPPPPPPKPSNPSQPDSYQLQNTSFPEEPQSSPPQADSIQTDNANDADSSKTTEDSSLVDDKKQQLPSSTVPYTIPPWSGPPCHYYSLEVLKDGAIFGQFDVNEKGAYMFGRVDLCDFVLEHPTISRFHAVLQFKSSGDAYLYDLGSTHGTFINKNQVKKMVYVELHVGDVIRFGHSSRLYIFQGPTELMPPEKDLKIIRKAKIREEMQDMEASLLRAKLDASLADGISWGMRDDAIEETEDDIDEITWQTYKGQLTEKQVKTREKVLKRLEKIAHMKKEIDAIRAKDIAQGGLTQGQQTQIARNEQRISQLMEELENLEETLNESIRESIGARTRRTSRNGKKGADDDEVENLSDDDDFYDRTKKHSKQKVVENQSIETADSLLDKKNAVIKEIEDKKKLLLEDENKMSSQSEVEAGDTLDAYMSGLSSRLVLDKKDQLLQALSTLQSEFDRVTYLLKIADPTGEAARKKKSKEQEPKVNVSKIPPLTRQLPLEQNKGRGVEQTGRETVEKQGTSDATVDSRKKTLEQNVLSDATDSKSVPYSVVKPQWLGAVEEKETKESQQEELPTSMQEKDEFVDYKDRNRILEKANTALANVDLEIESAAPGLIIRKRKQVEKSEAGEINRPQLSTSVGTNIRAEDAVALLLKHSKGYCGLDDGIQHDGDNMPPENQSGRDNKKPKRVLGPERPTFLGSGTEPDYESWVPPEGQSGDGRTSMNDRYGY